MIRSTIALAVAASLLSASAAHAAGNVKAKLKNGDLTLTGDSLDNDIGIEQVDAVIYVTGYSGTTINGSSGIAVTVTDDLKINLKDGDDYVYLGYVEVDDCSIKTGDGDDYVYLYGCTFDDDLTVDTGDDHDYANFQYTSVYGETIGKLGSGDDQLYVYEGYVSDDCEISTSDGYDYLDVAYSTFSGDVDVDLGDDDDSLQLTYSVYFDGGCELDGGNDEDSAYIGGAWADDLDVDSFEYLEN